MDAAKLTKLSRAPGGNLAEAYLQLRAQRDVFRKQAKEVEVRMELLSQVIRFKLHREKQDGFRAAGSTVYVYELTTASVSDAEAFLAYVKENDAFDLMETRASKEACETFAAEPKKTKLGQVFVDEDGDPIPQGPPPGVNLNKIEKLGVRKGK